MKKTAIFLFVLVLLNGSINAQSDNEPEKQKTKFTTGLQFISDQTYAGRTDSLKLPVLVPSFSIKTAGGFYTKLKGYLNLSSGNSGFDGVSIEPGYAISNKHWDISLSVIKNFISDSSNLIIAPIKTSLEFYAGNQNKIINPSAGAEYLFTNEGNDFIVYGGLSKNFMVSKKDKEPEINFEPGFSLTGGSQNFFFSFLKNYAANGKIKGRGRGSFLPVIISQTVKSKSQQFSLLSAEADLPVDISAGKFDCLITPTWETPVSLINKGGAGTQQDKSYVYLNVELSFNF